MRTYGALRLDGSTWMLSAEPHVVMRLKRVFGRIKPTRKGELAISDTAETAADLEWVLLRYPLDMDEVAAQRLSEQAGRYREAQEVVERIRAGHRLDFEREPACEKRDYQLEAADLCLTTGRLPLLCDDLGLGKSFSALMLLRDPESLPALIVCPTHLPPQWLEFLHKAWPFLVGHIIHKTTVYDPAALRGKYGTGGQTPDVLITSYSKLAGWATHLAGAVRTVVFDEAQELRRYGTDKYNAAALIADRARFTMGLTTTPIYNYGGEAFTVIDAIAHGVLGTREEFVQEWGAEMGNGRTFVREPGALGAHLRDEHLLVARTRRDVGRELSTEEPIQVPHLIDADEAVLNAETAGTVDLARMILAGEGTKEERFRASGDLDWQLRRATGMAKAPYVAAFVRMLLESEPKVLLLGWHRDVYALWQAIFDKANVGHVLYSGSESPTQKAKAKERFLGDDSCRVMMMSLRSGVGLDGLQEVCRVGVFGELDWSPGQHKQVLGRLHRDGQTDEVVGYFLHCDYGSDPTVMEVLGIKRGQAEPIRNPDAKLFETTEPAGERVRRLAAAVIAQRGGRA